MDPSHPHALLSLGSLPAGWPSDQFGPVPPSLPLKFPAPISSVRPPPAVQLNEFVRHLAAVPMPLCHLETPLPGVKNLLNQNEQRPVMTLPSPPPCLSAGQHSPLQQPKPQQPQQPTSPSPQHLTQQQLQQQKQQQLVLQQLQLQQHKPKPSQGEGFFFTGPSHVYHMVTFPNPQHLPSKNVDHDLAARKRKRWNPEDMERAIFQVEKKNMSARAAAMMCNVPRSTLWDRLCQRSSYQGRSQKAKRRRKSIE